jgi:hypothetical protein
MKRNPWENEREKRLKKRCRKNSWENRKVNKKLYRTKFVCLFAQNDTLKTKLADEIREMFQLRGSWQKYVFVPEYSI